MVQLKLVNPHDCGVPQDEWKRVGWPELQRLVCPACYARILKQAQKENRGRMETVSKETVSSEPVRRAAQESASDKPPLADA